MAADGDAPMERLRRIALGEGLDEAGHDDTVSDRIAPTEGLPPLVSTLDNSVHMASYEGKLREVQHLVLDEGRSLTAADDDGRTPFHWACAGGRTDVVRWLLEQDGKDRVRLAAAVDLVQGGWTPLHSAVSAQKEDVVRLLARNGANVSARNRNGCVPLHYHRGNAEIVQLLTDSEDGRACVNAQDRRGTTPLMRAAGLEHVAAARALLESGADVSVVDKEGNSALHWACEQGRAACVELLAEAGASWRHKNREGKTPSQIASPDLQPLLRSLRQGIA